MRSRVLAVTLALVLAGAAGPLCAATPPAGPVTLTGTRTITVTGEPLRGLAAGTYAVAEIDPTPGVRSLTYTAASVPTRGVQPLVESVHSVLVAPYGTPVESTTTDTVTGIDRGAGQAYAVNDVRTVTSTNLGEVSAVEHIVESDQGTNGVVIDSIDVTRRTFGNGAFEETGSAANAELHALHVGSDFSTTSHDQIPGFYLIDVTVGPPVLAADGTLTVAVSTATQGRTIGNVPIDTTSLVAPLWFTMQPMPTTAEHVAMRDVPVDRACGFATPPTAAFGVRDHRVQIDPVHSVTETTREVFSDTGWRTLCRIERTAITFGRVTTGKRTGTYIDITVVSRAGARAVASPARN